jgi:hypothetical protein
MCATDDTDVLAQAHAAKDARQLVLAERPDRS